MLLFDFIKRHIKRNSNETVSAYEYCPRCDANLTLQKGYSNELPYWNCRGCGEMLINPTIDADEDISWICDSCGSMLNIQSDFSSKCGKWICRECGFINTIDSSNIYQSEDEYQASLKNPYKGLSDEAVLELSNYEEVDMIGGREDILLVKCLDDDSLYVKKILKDYDISVYKYLIENPVSHMPKLIGIYEGSNNLVIIEEYIKGRTLAEILECGCLDQSHAIGIAIKLCRILVDLHSKEPAIIHRDIKPSNIIVANDGDVYLLDINVAKWYKPEENEDTRMYGTLYYAAPEQLGYGFAASSTKSDLYAVGMLLNVMLTNKLPKEEKASGPIWIIISRCISFEPEHRYSAKELIDELEKVQAI